MTEEEIAEAIRRYWAERGYAPDVVIVRIADEGWNKAAGKERASYFAARSNMVNGQPRRRAP